MYGMKTMTNRIYLEVGTHRWPFLPAKYVLPEGAYSKPKSYLFSKVFMYRWWTPMGTSWPVCAVCGRPSRTPEAHHLFVSRRFELLSVLNIVPVCSQGGAACHQQAHGWKKEVLKELMYRRLGDGDLELGKSIVEEAMKVWQPKSRD